MMKCFVIEDEGHTEWISEHDSYEEAWSEILHLSGIPWDHSPNRAPCVSWQTCTRDYVVHEYDATKKPWTLIRTIPAFHVGSNGVKWISQSDPGR